MMKSGLKNSKMKSGIKYYENLTEDLKIRESSSEVVESEEIEAKNNNN